jgi:MraZ protein
MADQRARFVGTYEHGLDDKGRMVLPSKIRAQLGETGMLAKLDVCLGLWTPQGFEDAADQLEAEIETGRATTGALRQFIADAHEVTPDQQGRIVIPQRLRSFANLATDVVITGRMKRAELWDARVWNDLSDGHDAELTAAVRAIGL